jgi:ATP-dependent helicase HrpB
LLNELTAIDATGRLTDEGRKLRQLPLPPRLARMVIDAAEEGAGELAASIAAVVTERGLGGDDVDLHHRLNQFRRDRSRRADEARAMVQRWASLSYPSSERGAAGEAGRGGVNSEAIAIPHVARAGLPFAKRGIKSVGAILAFAYPDRIAKNRGGGGGAFLLANGRGGAVDAASSFAREQFLVVAELTGAAAASRIVLAAPITLDEIEARFFDKIENRETVLFDVTSASLRARQSRKLGALVLAEQIQQVKPDTSTAHTFARGIISLGLDRLPWSKAALQFRTRVMFLRGAEGGAWPDLSNEGLAGAADEWLTPILLDKTALSDISADELSDAIMNLVPWPMRRRLDAEAPTHFTAPSGSSVQIGYDAEQGPTVSIRVQELFGLGAHPTIANGRVPLVIELLSPAHRPVQVTRDLPGFWRGSYADVKVEMRGRYPRHPWPDDPLTAPATRRAKPARNF